MSLINQVLNDLEKRGANALSGGDSISVVPVQRNRLGMVLFVATVLTLVVMVAKLWLSSSQPKTVAPVSVIQTPATKPVVASQAESQTVAAVVQEVRQEDSGQDESRQKAGGEAAGAAMHLSFELSSLPLPSSLRARTVTAATEQSSIKAASPSVHAAADIPKVRSDPHAAEGKALATTLASDGTTDETTGHLTNPAKDAGQVIGHNHSTRLANGTSLVAGYAAIPASGVGKQTSMQQQADNEFRRASGLMQQGHIDEAISGYEATLRLDADHDDARQALVGLLLKNKRNADAESVLQDGLKHNPKHSVFAMLLARLQVERDALPLAMDTLQKTLPYAYQQADYQAFIAALLQRQNRHTEAISRYQVTLQLAPNSGVWLMGLGISLQAVQRNEEARDAFKRAIESGNLSVELQAFVRQRLKEL